jgi:hypothetical protein
MSLFVSLKHFIIYVELAKMKTILILLILLAFASGSNAVLPQTSLQKKQKNQRPILIGSNDNNTLSG